MEDYAKVLLHQDQQTKMTEELKTFAARKAEWKKDPNVLEQALKNLSTIFLSAKPEGVMSPEELIGFAEDVTDRTSSHFVFSL